MISPPDVDGRRVQRFERALQTYAAQYTPDLDLSDSKGAGPALFRIFAQLAETVAVRLDLAPQKHFAAFLDALGVVLVPARAARAAVTFKLANGLTRPVRVPIDTRVTAPGPDEEVPFETIAELVAIPGALSAIYAVNPEKDAVFRPPPDFLEQKPRASSTLSYQVQSFVNAGADRLQLDHATDLKPGSYLHIDCREKHVVRKIDENILTLEHPLGGDVEEGASVVPIRDFEAFDGINVQEHVLYIGHSRVLNVKTEAVIRLDVALATRSAMPLDLVWEFWTKDETLVPEEEEHWQALPVQMDGTNGLTKSGRITLLKPVPAGYDTELEIKPRLVNARESRWIRARVQGQLRSGANALPAIASIEIAVESPLISVEMTAQGQEERRVSSQADQGFYNATPLDVKVDENIGFFPFGSEPRQFDQFYIASKEAFSKRGARVELDFRLDIQKLGALAVIQADGVDDVVVYAIGARRRLHELKTASGVFEPLGDPSAVVIDGPEGSRQFPVDGSSPAAVADAKTGVTVIALMAAEVVPDAPRRLWIYLRKPGGGNPWVLLDTPVLDAVPAQLRFSPAAMPLPASEGLCRIVVVDSNGRLHSRIVTDVVGTISDWRTHQPPNGVTLKCSPFTVVDEPPGSGRIYATGIAADGNRNVYQFDFRDDTWTELVASDAFQPFSRPFAATFEEDGQVQAKVFVVGYVVNGEEKQWDLRECTTDVEPMDGMKQVVWETRGLPDTKGFDLELREERPDDCAPSGFVEHPAAASMANERKHIFLRSPDGGLFERMDAGSWVKRLSLDDASAILSPVAISRKRDDTTSLQALAATSRNSVLRWQFDLIEGDIPGTPKGRVALLASNAGLATKGLEYDGDFLDVLHVDRPGQIVPIERSDVASRTVRVKEVLEPLPISTSQIRVLKKEQAGTAPAGDDLELPGVVDATGKIVDIKGKRRRVIRFDNATHVAIVQPELAGPLSQATPFTLYELTHESAARSGADRTVLVKELEQEPEESTPRQVAYLRLHSSSEVLAAESFSPLTGAVVLVDMPGTIAAGQGYTLALTSGTTATEFKPADETDAIPELSWEYWNGRGWLSIPGVRDGTRSLLASGKVVFTEMPAVEATEVAGQDNFWIRVRLVGGDYGREIFRIQKGGSDGKNGTDTVVPDKSSLHPPKVAILGIIYVAKPVPLEVCLTFNNLNYLDQTAASQLGGAHFSPFEALSEPRRAVFFGFELPFKSGPVRVLLDAAERELADPRTPPAFRWEFRKDHEWRELAADDESQALTRQGLLTLSASHELTRDTLFGTSLFWIRGMLRVDRERSHESYPNPLLRGVFPNTVWASQGETITDEIVASSDGSAGQRHPLQHGNVLREQQRDVVRGEEIRVLETLSIEEREQIEQREGIDSVVDRDDIGGPWVRWREVRAFFDVGPGDRCYSVDRAAGILRFGDGRRGFIPPAGVDNIRAFRYRTGGGAAGNVAPNGINTLATAVQGIESVFNPTSAGGGSDTVTTETMLRVGPQQISHRDRAVSPEDFEELAVESTRQVAKARCLASTHLRRLTSQLDPCHPAQRHDALDARGWVSVIIVPRSPDPLPCPSLELRRTVLDYLRERAPTLLVHGERLVVRPPDYVVVSVGADLFVDSLEHAADVEEAADRALRKLLHPLEGGPEGAGWDFGRTIAASDVFAVLEAIRHVDYVEALQFKVVGRPDSAAGVEIGPHQLLASGTHTLRISRNGA